MTGTIKTTTVMGVTYEVWSDFIKRATFAKNIDTQEIKKIHGSGYLKNDLSIRKAISMAYETESFRK